MLAGGLAGAPHPRHGVSCIIRMHDKGAKLCAVCYQGEAIWLSICNGPGGVRVSVVRGNGILLEVSTQNFKEELE